MASSDLCPQPEGNPDERSRDGARDLVLYSAVGAVVATIGVFWHGILSMILTPVWMLFGVWWLPARITRDRSRS